MFKAGVSSSHAVSISSFISKARQRGRFFDFEWNVLGWIVSSATGLMPVTYQSQTEASKQTVGGDDQISRVDHSISFFHQFVIIQVLPPGNLAQLGPGRLGEGYVFPISIHHQLLIPNLFN
jgi:hypothetical protein